MHIILMSDNTNMQAVLKEKQTHLVDAILSKTKNADAKNKKFISDESSDDAYTDDSSDDDYMDLESIINEQNTKIAALEERMTTLESSK